MGLLDSIKTLFSSGSTQPIQPLEKTGNLGEHDVTLAKESDSFFEKYDWAPDAIFGPPAKSSVLQEGELSVDGGSDLEELEVYSILGSGSEGPSPLSHVWPKVQALGESILLGLKKLPDALNELSKEGQPLDKVDKAVRSIFTEAANSVTLVATDLKRTFKVEKKAPDKGEEKTPETVGEKAPEKADKKAPEKADKKAPENSPSTWGFGKSLEATLEAERKHNPGAVVPRALLHFGNGIMEKPEEGVFRIQGSEDRVKEVIQGAKQGGSELPRDLGIPEQATLFKRFISGLKKSQFSSEYEGAKPVLERVTIPTGLDQLEAEEKKTAIFNALDDALDLDKRFTLLYVAKVCRYLNANAEETKMAYANAVTVLGPALFNQPLLLAGQGPFLQDFLAVSKEYEGQMREYLSDPRNNMNRAVLDEFKRIFPEQD